MSNQPPATLAKTLTLQLHAYPALSLNGRAVPIKLKHGLALLAYLSEQRGPVGREALAALLWPECNGAVGRARLRRLVHTLHGALGGSLVEGDADVLRLAAGWHSDVQATRAAIAHAHGTAALDAQALAPLLQPQAARWLDGFTLDAEPFSEWQDSQRRTQQAAVLRALERAAERAVAQRDADLAERIAAALLQIEPCAEAGHIALLQARGLRGAAAGVETAYFECAQALRRELGVRPSAAVETAYARAVAATQGGAPGVRIGYAPTRHGDVAYATWGRGETAIVVLWGMMSNVEVALDEPRARALLDRLAERHRVVMLDRRGSGLSERVGVEPNAENAAEDIVATLDQLGIERAWLFGSSVGGTLALDFALRCPERTAGLLLFGTSACGSWQQDWPWALRQQAFEAWITRLTDPAHYDDSLRRFAPSAADDAAVRRWYARLLRNAASRIGAVALLRAYQQMDLRARLPAVRVPTLVLQRRGDRTVPFAAGQQLARAIPKARFAPLDGDDHFLWHGDSGAVLAAVEAFVAAQRTPSGHRMTTIPTPTSNPTSTEISA